MPTTNGIVLQQFFQLGRFGLNELHRHAQLLQRLRHIIAGALHVAHAFGGGLHIQRHQLHLGGRVVHLRHDVRVVDLVQGAVGLSLWTTELELDRTALRIL
jgi:hypothetical protein